MGALIAIPVSPVLLIRLDRVWVVFKGVCTWVCILLIFCLGFSACIVKMNVVNLHFNSYKLIGSLSTH